MNPLPLRVSKASADPTSTERDVIVVITSEVEQRKSWGRSRLSNKLTERPASFPPYYSGVRAEHVRTVDDLAHVFNAMSPFETVIRAAMRPGSDKQRFRRAIEDDHDKGPGAFVKVARSWVLFDFDKLSGDWDEPTDDEDFDLIAEALRDLLPPAFRSARCHWRRSGSNGFKPWFKDGKFNARMHLVFMLSQPLTSDQLRSWALSSGCDRATLHPVTPHFVVPPDLTGHDGLESVVDPFSVRSGFIEGDHLRVQVPENLPAAPTRLKAPVAAAAGEDWSCALDPDSRSKMRANVSENAYTEIASAAKGEHHPAITKQGYMLARLIPSGLLTGDEVVNIIVGAAEAHYGDAHHPKVSDAQRSAISAVKKMDEGVFHPLRVGDLPAAYIDGLGFGAMRQMAYYQDVGELMPSTGKAAQSGTPKLTDFNMPQALSETKEAYQALFTVLIEAGEKVYTVPSNTGFGAGLCRILHEPKGVIVKPLTVVDLTLVLMQHVNLCVWEKAKKDKDGYYRPAKKPEVRSIAGDLLDMTDPMVPVLRAVISSPQFRPDGSVITTPGYDVTTGRYFDHPSAVDALPDLLERNDGLRAIEDIRHLIRGFPFEREVDFATILASMLTAVAKPMIQGPCPMFMVLARDAGTGKSKLVRIVAAIIDGSLEPRYIQAYDKPEETRKQITSALMGATRTIVSWDNVKNGASFGNPYLAQLATSMLWTDRALNTNSSIELEVSSVFFVTGNNISPSDDMQRRCLICSLDAKMENPERRVFTGPPPEVEAMELRNPLALALVTILKAYLAAGRPAQKGTPFGSFEVWASLVRDALLWYDLPDVAATISATQLNDPTKEAKSGLLAGLQQWFGDSAFDVKDVINLCEGSGSPGHLAKFAGGVLREDITNELKFLCNDLTVRNVSYLFRALNGQISHGLSLKRRENVRRKGRWTVIGEAVTHIEA